MTFSAVNETFYEEFLVEASKAIALTQASEVVFELIIYVLMAILAFQIYKEIAKLYSFIEYEGLRYFKNTFFFYGIANLLLTLMSLGFLLLKISLIKGLDLAVLLPLENLKLLFLAVVLFLFLLGICFWLAKANLLASITWRLAEEYVRMKKIRKYFFFLSLMLFVILDASLELTLLTQLGIYVAFGYRALMFVLILLLIRSNMLSGEEAKPISHPYYLALILLFTVNFLSHSLNIIEEGYTFLYTALDILTVFAYVIILKGIKKWSRILVE